MTLREYVKKVWLVLTKQEYRFKFLSYFDFYKNYSDEEYLTKLFPLKTGYSLNLHHPGTFNEKIQWLKVYDHNPLYTTLVDKYEVKNYARGLIGDDYIVPALGVWDRFEAVDFDSLPEKFVLKCTHDSGGVVIVEDKYHFNRRKAGRKLKKCLKRNYYWHGREWAYKNVKPRIIAEQYLGSNINDYKFLCFNGKVLCSFVCSGRADGDLRVTFFDNDWNVLPFERHYPKSEENIPAPQSLELMIQLSEHLAKDTVFVRVDFYECCGQPYLGELTLYPGCGFEEFTPYEWDIELGSWLTLPDKE